MTRRARSTSMSIVTSTALLGALFLAACTTEQQSDPAPTLSSTTSTTSTTIADTTTTTTPPDTTEAATTVASTTTVPAGPAAVDVPLLVGGADGGWLYLGSWAVDRWAEPLDSGGLPLDPPVGVGSTMTVSNLAGEATGVTGAFVEACFDERQGPTIDTPVAPPDPPGFGYNAVALTGNTWPLKPRPVADTRTGPATYQELGEGIFAGDAVDASVGTVQQVVVADLDGDGDDEAVVAFDHIQPSAGPGAIGDFAALFLVDTDTRATSPIFDAAVVAADADFPLITNFRVLDVADLNGDGRMEVLVHVWYYEGASVYVLEYDGATLTEVLATGCGS